MASFTAPGKFHRLVAPRSINGIENAMPNHEDLRVRCKNKRDKNKNTNGSEETQRKAMVKPSSGPYEYTQILAYPISDTLINLTPTYEVKASIAVIEINNKKNIQHAFLSISISYHFLLT